MIKFKKTKKYQSGGGIPLYQASPKSPVYTQPLQFMQEGTASPAKSSTASSAFKPEWEGLPGEVALLEEQHNQAMGILNNASELDILSGTQEIQKAQQILNKIHSASMKAKLKSNQAEFERISATVKDKASAFVTNGNKTLADVGGKLNYLTAEEIAQGKGVPITVAKLNNIRRNSTSYSFDVGNSVYLNVDNTDTLENINKFLNDQIKGTNKEERELITKGLAATAVKAGQEGYSGFKNYVSSNENALRALENTWVYLDEDQKQQLRMSAIANYGAKDKTTIENTAKMIMSMVFAKTYSSKSSQQFETDDALLTGAKSGDGLSGSKAVGQAEFTLIGGNAKPLTGLVGNVRYNTMGAFTNAVSVSEATGKEGTKGLQLAAVKDPANMIGKLVETPQFKTLKGNNVDPSTVVISNKDSAYVIAATRDVNGNLKVHEQASKEFQEKKAEFKKRNGSDPTPEQAKAILQQIDTSGNLEFAVLFTAKIPDIPENEDALDSLGQGAKVKVNSRDAKNYALFTEQFAESRGITAGSKFTELINIGGIFGEMNPDYYEVNLIAPATSPEIARYNDKQSFYTPTENVSVGKGLGLPDKESQISSSISGDYGYLD